MEETITPSDDKKWYALRVTYSREMALKAYLTEQKIENFIPMRYADVVKNEQRTRKLVPAIHNLVFVHTTRKIIDAVKSEERAGLPPVRYIMDRETRQPVVVPDGQMKSFIAVAGNYDEQIIYLDPAEIKLRKGDMVRVVGGLFEGAVGRYVRIKNDRRVVVLIEGLMAVATVPIHPSLIERIEEEKEE
jgi:transcription antitermination factor NusG